MAGRSKAASTAGGGSGGRRAGAGRPRAEVTKARDDIDAVIQGLIGPDIPEFYLALKGLALGGALEGDQGVVYTERPSFPALAYLIDRVAGKPRQAVEIKKQRADARQMAEAVAERRRKQLEVEAGPGYDAGHAGGPGGVVPGGGQPV